MVEGNTAVDGRLIVEHKLDVRIMVTKLWHMLV